MGDKWTLRKEFTAELRVVSSDEEFFEFAFDSEGADWARMRIDRVSGEAIELHKVDGNEILAAKSSCRQTEKQF